MSDYRKENIDFSILDSIRGIAAFYVLVAHCRGILWVGINKYLKVNPLENWEFNDYFTAGMMTLTRLSTEFVILFFVLSGFSIAHSVSRTNKKKQFYKRRFIRLYPPYIAAVLWAILIFIIIRYVSPELTDGTFDTINAIRIQNTAKIFDLKEIAKTLLYIPTKGGFLHPFWSLTYEVIFYAFAFLFIRNRRIYYVASIIVFLIGIGLTFSDYHSPNILYNFIFEYNLYFMLGVFLYFNYNRVADYVPISSFWPFTIIIGVYFATLGANILAGSHSALSNILAAIGCYYLIIFLLEKNIHISIFKSIGKYSYTLYITHFATIFLFLLIYYNLIVNELIIFNPFVFLFAIPFSLFFAYINYLLVEDKTKQLLQKMRRKS